MMSIIKRLFTDYKTTSLAAIVVIIAAFVNSIYQLINSHSWATLGYTSLAVFLFIVIVGMAMQASLEFKNDSLSKFMGYFETKDALNSSWYHSSERLKAIESEIDEKSEVVVVSRYLNYEQNDTDSFLGVVRKNINIRNIKYSYVIKNAGENMHIRQTLENEFKEKIEIIEVPEIDFDYPSDIIYYSPPSELKKPISLFMELPSHKEWKQRGWIKIESKETGVIIDGIKKTITKYKKT